MECTGCHAKLSDQLHLNCPACARSALYPHRVSLAQTLLERQHLSQKVEESLVISLPSSRNEPSSKAADQTLISGRRTTHHLEEIRAQLEQTQKRLEQARHKCSKLTQDIQFLREQVRKRQDEHGVTRRIFNVAKKDILAKQDKTNESLRRSTAKTATRHDSLHSNMLSHRAELCREAARVARFRTRRLSASDGRVALEFEIFGTYLPNLFEINRTTPQELSLSLNHLSRLISLICRYLQVRLPAQILLPSAVNSHPVIFTPANSYYHYSTNFRDSGSTQKVDTNQRYSVASVSPPNPRPLHLDKPLANLAKEDPKSYALFVEGIALLAWDTAWLCRSQGLPVAPRNWQDACCIGENLWLLTIGNRSQPSETCAIDYDANSHSSQALPGTRADAVGEMAAFLGRYSHGSAFSTASFLDHRDCDLPSPCGISESSWVFASSTRFVDCFKNHLQADLYGQEWEFLEEHDYRGVGDDPVMVGLQESHTIRSKNGWTKLRPRPR